MDALKLIAQDSLKAEVPSFEVGDSVRVHVKIKEGDRERIQVFEGTRGLSLTNTVTNLLGHPMEIPLRSTAALQRPLPFAAFPMAAVWREFSRCILRTWTRWRLSVRVAFAVRNCTTSETEWARLQRSNPKSDSFDKAKAGANQRRLLYMAKIVQILQIIQFLRQ